MGMGHVPQDSPRAEGARAEFQGPQHRRAAPQHDLAQQARGRAAARQARARFAEDLVAAWYVREGYTIIARNWRCPRGELDVVAWRDGVLVVCEVKARRTTNFGDPFEAITPQKVAKLRRATAAFIAQLRDVPSVPHMSELRFDAAAVLGVHLTLRENVG